MVTQSTLILVNIMVIFIVGDLHTLKISCPDPAQWAMRAKGFCNASFPSYVCLLDDNNNRMIETCEKQPDFQTPGYRFVIRGGYDGKPCDGNRYQPFTFWTDGNSDCVFSKSKCEDEGQLYSDFGGTTSDVSCRCDYTKGYAFISTPINPSACSPSHDDCSCYLKTCKDNMVLAADYTCRTMDDTETEVKLPPIKGKWSKDNIYKETTTMIEQHQWTDETSVLWTNRSVLHVFVILNATITCVVLLGVMTVLRIRERRLKMCFSQPDCHTDIENGMTTYQTSGTNTVKSRKIKCILEKLKSKVIVTVISDCDDFRSSVVNNVIAKMHKRYDYVIVYSSFKLEEVAKVMSNTHKTVIVIKDMFENDTGDMQTLRRWHNLFTYLNFHTGVKICITCKPHVFQTYLFQHISFLADTIFDLDLQTSLYDVNCDIGNQRLYLTYQELSALQVDQTKARDELFLILCKRYAGKKIQNDIESVEIFFSDYDNTIKEDLRRELQRGDKSSIVSLMLIIIYNNCLAIHMVSLKNLRITNILLHLAELPEIGKPLSSNNIRDDLEILSRSYVEKSEQHYRIGSAKLYSIILSFLAEQLLPSLIQLAEPEVIRNNFVLNSITPFKDSASNIPLEYEGLYLNRLCHDIRAGLLSHVLDNGQMECETFRTKLIEHITTDDATIRTLNSLSNQVVSPILFVAEKGYCDMVRFFVRRDFKIDVKNIKGSTPLLLACQYGHAETVKYLLIEHADYNICNNEGNTPLIVASENGFSEIVQLLLEHDYITAENEKIPRNYTAVNNNKQGFGNRNRFTAISSNANIKSNKRKTPLYAATVAGHDKIVQILLEYKADVNECSMSKRSPLHAAIERGNLRIVELLLKYQCKLDLFDNWNETALHIALRKEHSDIIAILIKTGASPYNWLYKSDV